MKDRLQAWHFTDFMTETAINSITCFLLKIAIRCDDFKHEILENAWKELVDWQKSSMWDH